MSKNTGQAIEKVTNVYRIEEYLTGANIKLASTSADHKSFTLYLDDESWVEFKVKSITLSIPKGHENE